MNQRLVTVGLVLSILAIVLTAYLGLYGLTWVRFGKAPSVGVAGLFGLLIVLFVASRLRKRS